MKTFSKFLIVFLLTALLLAPASPAVAKGLTEGKVVFGNSYTVESGQTLDGDLVIFGGTATVEDGGKVRGAVVLMGGSAAINGEVTKDVVVIGGAASLGEKAHVRGSLVTMGAPIQRAEGARVDGEVLENAQPPVVDLPNTPEMPDTPETPNLPNRFDGLLNPVWEVVNLFVRSFVLSMLALLIGLFLPEQTRRVGEAAAAMPLQTGGLGLLTIFVAPLAMFMMVITILLIPVAALAVLLLGIAMVFGWLGLGMEIGLRFAKMMPGGENRLPLPMAAAIGTFLLTIVANGIGLIDCIGWIAPFTLSMLGLGAVLLTRFGTRPALLTASPTPVESALPVNLPEA